MFLSALRDSPLFKPLLGLTALMAVSACGGKSGNDVLNEGGAQPEATAADISIDNAVLERDMATILRGWNAEGTGAPVVRINADGTTTVIDADMARVPAANQDADHIAVATFGNCAAETGGTFMGRPTNGEACTIEAPATTGRINPDGSMTISYQATPNPMFGIQHRLTVRPDGQNCGVVHFNRVATATGQHGVLDGTNPGAQRATAVRTEGDYRICYGENSGFRITPLVQGR